MGFCEVGEGGVARGGIQAAGPPEFQIAHGAEGHRGVVAFGEIVGAVHAAFVERAVFDAEHVAGFVRRHLQRAAKHGGVVFLRIAVAGERPHADAFFERCLAEDEIPRGLRKKIRCREAEHRHGVLRAARQQHTFQNVGAEELLHAPLGMRAACAVGNRGVWQGIEDFHRHAEMDAQDFRRVFHERLLRFGEIADGLDVKCRALRSRAVRAGGEVLIKRLPVLGMLREPVASGGPRFLLHQRLELRGVSAQSLERWRFLSGCCGDEEGDDERGEPVFHGGTLARRPAGSRGFVVRRRETLPCPVPCPLLYG